MSLVLLEQGFVRRVRNKLVLLHKWLCMKRVLHFLFEKQLKRCNRNLRHTQIAKNRKDYKFVKEWKKRVRIEGEKWDWEYLMREGCGIEMRLKFSRKRHWWMDIGSNGEWSNSRNYMCREREREREFMELDSLERILQIHRLTLLFFFAK